MKDNNIEVQNIDVDQTETEMRTQIMRVDDEECINDRDILFINQQQVQLAPPDVENFVLRSGRKARHRTNVFNRGSKKINKTLEMLQESLQYETQRPYSARAVKAQFSRKNLNDNAGEQIEQQSSNSTAVFEISTTNIQKTKTQTWRRDHFQNGMLNTVFGQSEETPLKAQLSQMEAQIEKRLQ